MNFEIVGSTPKVPKAGISPKDKFEERLRAINEHLKLPGETRDRIKSKHVPEGGYRMYFLMCEYIVIRCYKSYFTIHAAGDIDHYRVKKANYDEVAFEVPDLVFLARLLRTDDEYEMEEMPELSKAS